MLESNIDNILNSLNKEQLEAVTTTEGYVRVIAGAGSGKTRALTTRYTYIVNELGISTANILCVTFTNKAANEMKRRIRKMIGDKDLGLICTFHGFCVQVLREDITKINYPKNFIILDKDDTEAILKNIYKEKNIKSADMTFQKAREYIGGCKRVGRVQEYTDYFVSTDDSQLFDKYMSAKSVEDKIFYGYLYEQKKNYGLDFEDLLNITIYIFEKYNSVLSKWQNRLEYIMVDEFQDVGKRQYLLCDMLSHVHKNLFIVGDPDQTIYSWRGADIQRILNFDKKFPGTKTILMNTNYRSSPNIIDVSNSLIRNNRDRFDKQLVPVKNEDTMTIYYHAKTNIEEAEWIANQILLLKNVGVKLNNIAILYRAHSISRAVEEALIRTKLEYIIYSGISFYGRKEIKDILSYLRMVVDADDLSFARIINEPKRNIGDKRIEVLKEYSSKNKCSLYEALKANLDTPLFKKTGANDFVETIEKYRKIYSEKTIAKLTKELLNETGYEEMLKLQGEDERLENLSELYQSIYDYESTIGEDISLEDYLSQIALYTSTDKEHKKDTISMMTIHTAKGLEFPYVFVCGMNEGIFPSKKTDTLKKLEEERRLAYVAFTRAEKALFLSDAEGYNYDHSFRYPSRFIFNIDKKTIKYSVELEERLMEEAQQFIQITEMSLDAEQKNIQLSEGDIVEHKHFGKGKIIDVNKSEQMLIIKFDNLSTNRVITMKTPLTKIDG